MAHDGVRKMGVRVDAARYDDETCGIDYARGPWRQRAGRHHGRDALALDRDVPGPDPLRSDHLPAPHDEIDHGAEPNRASSYPSTTRTVGVERPASDIEPRHNR